MLYPVHLHISAMMITARAEEKRADSGKEAQPYRMGFSDTGSSADLLDQLDTGAEQSLKTQILIVQYGCKNQCQNQHNRYLNNQVKGYFIYPACRISSIPYMKRLRLTAQTAGRPSGELPFRFWNRRLSWRLSFFFSVTCITYFQINKC